MRSARHVILACAALLVAVPLALVGIAWLYEGWSLASSARELHAIARLIATAAPGTEVEEQYGVLAIHLDAQGQVVSDSGTRAQAIHRSTVGGWLDRLVDWGEPEPAVSWESVEQRLPPLRSREEVVGALAGRSTFRVYPLPAGSGLLYSHAEPDGAGGVWLIERASQRGMRRLVNLRRELLKIVLWQILAAGLVSLVLARQLVWPLEKLARSVHRFPETQPTDGQLLDRPDEVGQLARAVHRMAAQLEGRRRATADLAADVAHELKNPLATIAASAELFGTTQDPSLEKRALLERQITHAVERLRLNADELLALARLEAALPDTPRVTVSYADFLEAVLAEYRSDPRYARFQLALRVDPDELFVRVAAEPWARLLRNLLDNALVQPTDTPRIEVTATREGTSIRTSVRDFGPGVSPGNREKIFRRFFTQRPPGTPEGTGLGLSIVQTVAAAHGGSVELCEVEGPGACFSVVAPLH